MPRFSRSAPEYYHVVLRGNRREVLTHNAQDRRALNEIAIATLRHYDIVLHGYCLMPHQLRALIQVDRRCLSKALRRVATRYARYRHPERSKPDLFERPYTAQRIDPKDEFLTCLRSIHLNPVVANKVVAPDDYPWSSHPAYVGYRSNALITTAYGLSLLADDPARARTAYHQFITAGVTTDVGIDANEATQSLAIAGAPQASSRQFLSIY